MYYFVKNNQMTYGKFKLCLHIIVSIGLVHSNACHAYSYCEEDTVVLLQLPTLHCGIMKILTAYNSWTEVRGLNNLTQIKQSNESHDSFTRDNTEAEMSFRCRTFYMMFIKVPFQDHCAPLPYIWVVGNFGYCCSRGSTSTKPGGCTV